MALGWKIWTYDIQGVSRSVFLPSVWCFLLVSVRIGTPKCLFLEDRKHLRTLSFRIRNSVGMFLPPVFQIKELFKEVFPSCVFCPQAEEHFCVSFLCLSFGLRNSWEVFPSCVCKDREHSRTECLCSFPCLVSPSWGTLLCLFPLRPETLKDFVLQDKELCRNVPSSCLPDKELVREVFPSCVF